MDTRVSWGDSTRYVAGRQQDVLVEVAKKADKANVSPYSFLLMRVDNNHFGHLQGSSPSAGSISRPPLLKAQEGKAIGSPNPKMKHAKNGERMGGMAPI